MAKTSNLAESFNLFWDSHLLPVFKTIEPNWRDCSRVSDSNALIDDAIDAQLRIAVNLKRQLLFEQANQQYISITKSLLKNHGIVHSTVLCNWFKVLAPATLFKEALQVLVFSRLISIRFTQKYIVEGNRAEAQLHCPKDVFDQLRSYETALSGSPADLEVYLRKIVGNPSYSLPAHRNRRTTPPTRTDFEVLKTEYLATKNLPFAFFAAGIQMHGNGWSLRCDNPAAGFHANGDYNDMDVYMLSRRGGKYTFDESEEGFANRAFNLLTQHQMDAAR